MKQSTEADANPEVWGLLGEKAGDNNQVLALIEGLGLPYQIKQLSYRKTELLTNLLQQPTLLGVSRQHVSELVSPWPKILIAAGRRSEPVAQWVKKQSRGSTRLVHLGRPWRHSDNYDLVISTPQYCLAEADNILTNTLPLHRLSKDRLRRSAESWRPRLDKYSPPYTVLLAGGNSGAYIFDRNSGKSIGTRANQLVEKNGGSLLITSSGRTPAELIEGIINEITVPYYLYRWMPNDSNNPYLAFLSLASRIIVTGESISMLGEALSTGKPVYIYHPQHLQTSNRSTLQQLSWASFSHTMSQRLAPQRVRRNISPLLDQLVQQNHATWIENTEPFTPAPMQDNDLSRAITAVHKLLG